MTFPRYPAYKNSEVEWIGEVPQGWDVRALKRVVKLRSEKAEDRTFAVALENIESWSGRYVEAEGTYATGGTTFDAGDILFGKLRPYLAKAWLADRSGEAVGDFHVLRCRAPNRPEFIQKLILCSEMVSLIDGSTYGAKMPRASWEFIGTLSVPIPPPNEQDAVVSFLDRETAKIDALVDEQKRLIELLKEKRRAVISHSVTKGLDPNVPMKNSGVEWLGNVPAHWEIERGRRLFQKVEILPEAEDGVVTAFRDGQVTLRENRRTEGFTLAVLEVGYQRVRKGDLVIHGMDAFAGAIGVSESTGKCSPEYSVLAAVRHGVDNTYFAAVLRQMALRNFIYVICPSVRERAPRFRFETFKDVELPVPPLDEQQKIVERLAATDAEANSLIDEAERMVALLRERRAALISAAVTGKIDVRGTAPNVASIALPDRVRLRTIVAAEIIERLASKHTFGRVKLQKLVYLAEAHANVNELQGDYLREAAGPLDRDMIEEIETRLQSDGVVAVEQPGGKGTRVTYQVRQRGTYRQEAAGLLSSRASGLKRLVDLLGDLDIKSVEAIATLYAVWNDALLDEVAPTDDSIISGFLNDWHPEKRKKFKPAELRIWLDWMRRHELVPKGTGPRTTTGRLFA